MGWHLDTIVAAPFEAPGGADQRTGTALRAAVLSCLSGTTQTVLRSEGCLRSSGLAEASNADAKYRRKAGRTLIILERNVNYLSRRLTVVFTCSISFGTTLARWLFLTVERHVRCEKIPLGDGGSELHHRRPMPLRDPDPMPRIDTLHAQAATRRAGCDADRFRAMPAVRQGASLDDFANRDLHGDRPYSNFFRIGKPIFLAYQQGMALR